MTASRKSRVVERRFWFGVDVDYMNKERLRWKNDIAE